MVKEKNKEGKGDMQARDDGDSLHTEEAIYFHP